MKKLIRRICYRTLRNDMVVRMQMQGMSWANINKALFACGQQIVVSYEHVPERKGIQIRFGKPDMDMYRRQQLTAKALKRKNQ